MASPKFNRDDRLTILAQVCIDNGVTPQKGNFAGLIRKVCLSHLGISELAAKELTRTLTTIYRSDQWSGLLHPELAPDETVGESGLEANKISLIYTEPTKICNGIVSIPPSNPAQDRDALHAEMQQLAQNSHPEPVKTLEAHTSRQLDHIPEKQTAAILHTFARRDTFDGVGRIILSDARDILDDKHLQIDDLLLLWRRYYPTIDIESKSNVALIYWDGKGCVQDYRKANVIIQPKAPVFDPKTQEQGDISEDDAEGTSEAKDT
jgi:hypothetical protein